VGARHAGGGDGKFEIYEDDGVTCNYQKADYLKVMCEWQDGARQTDNDPDSRFARAFPAIAAPRSAHGRQ
jgi:hypothetical protein